MYHLHHHHPHSQTLSQVWQCCTEILHVKMRNIFTTLKRYKLCLSDFDELFLVVPLVSCILFSALFQQSLLLLFYSINDVISKVNVDNNTLISLALLAPLLSSQALPIFLLFQEQTLKIEILRNKMSST